MKELRKFSKDQVPCDLIVAGQGVGKSSLFRDSENAEADHFQITARSAVRGGLKLWDVGACDALRTLYKQAHRLELTRAEQDVVRDYAHLWFSHITRCVRKDCRQRALERCALVVGAFPNQWVDCLRKELINRVVVIVPETIEFYHNKAIEGTAHQSDNKSDDELRRILHYYESEVQQALELHPKLPVDLFRIPDDRTEFLEHAVKEIYEN